MLSTRSHFKCNDIDGLKEKGQEKIYQANINLRKKVGKLTNNRYSKANIY